MWQDLHVSKMIWYSSVEAVDHYFSLSFPKSKSGGKDLGASSLSGKQSGEVRLGKGGNR